MARLFVALSFLVLLGSLALLLFAVAWLIGVPLLYNYRNLLVRWRTSLSVGLAFTLVIGLLIIMLAFMRGLRQVTEGSGHPANVVVLSRGATDELTSSINVADSGDVAVEEKRILKDARGHPLCSRELLVVIHQILPARGDGKQHRQLVAIRGIENSGAAAEIRNLGPLLQGNWFSSSGISVLPADDSGRGPRDAVEAVAGQAFARQWGLAVGDILEVGPRFWVITGILPSAGATFDSEIWASQQQVDQIFRKEGTFTSLLLRTPDAATARSVCEFINGPSYKKASLHAETEPEYYARFAATNQTFLVSVYLLAAVLAVGGSLGVMNTMFAAINQRRKDIAMLRILGFSRTQVLLSFLIESLLLAVIGGGLGCLLGSLTHGNTASNLAGTRTMAVNQVFTLNVDLQTQAIAIIFLLAMGALGGLLPALATVRVSPLEALRAG
jgi:hypothetical protein